MDILCTCCGEPWDVYSVLHEDPAGFTRQGCLVTACPYCSGKPPADQTVDRRNYLDAIAETALLHGNDIDGFACFVEDLLYRS
jgi:hypothetical protein